MRLREQNMTLPPERNQVLLHGEMQGAEHYIHSILSGFDQGYGFLLKHRDELIEGPLAHWRQLPLRAVIRATRTYGMLLGSTANAATASDGVEASIARDVVTRPFLALDECPPAFGALAAEMRALAQGDIPLFTTAADSVDLQCPGGERTEKFFARSGDQVMRDGIGALSLEDLAAQRSLIRAAFAAVPYQARPEDQTPEGVLSNADLIGEAISIAHQIRDHAIRGADGQVFWLAVHPVGDDGWVR